MTRNGRWIGSAILVLAVLFWGGPGQPALAGSFDFDDGTVQGWTLQGAFDPEINNITFPCNFTNGWNDYFNYPEAPGSDPAGNMRGSLQMYTPGGHGIDNPDGEWWLMQFYSPDLSTSESWQRAFGYSVRIAESMGGGLITLYANLFVKVYDLDLDRERFFANGVAAPLAYNTWSYQSQNWWDLPNFPTNYVIREVFVNIWGLMADGSHLNGGVYLDEVIPFMPIYVDDDGGGPEEDGSWEHPFDSIQEGINAALNGEMVIVRDGTYTGEGNRDIDFLGLAITVHSENGPNTCIIDCEGTTEENHRGYYFHSGEDADSVLEGFTIINGFAQDGGGICCNINSSPSIRNCVIRDCNANLGAGIYCNNSNPTITRCMISNCDASSGGGIYSNRSDPTITSCTFNGNQVSNYGGAICCYNSNPVINNCTIQGNSAIDLLDSYGGGIYCNKSSATVKNCIFWGNTAGLSGAEIALVDTSNTSELTISYSDVEGGFAAAYVEEGCTLDWDVGNIDMDPCLMPDNYHLQSCSPCIDFGDPLGDYTDQTDIDGYSRIFNARVDIGADEFSPPIHNVTQDTYHDTIQLAIDGAANGDTISIPDGIYTGPGNRDVHFNGKAITVRSENGPDNCVIDCDGTEGGVDHRGFCFNHNEDANSVLDGITITNGYCIIGGGIWCYYSSPTIINCIIRGNTANDEGGGILCAHSSATISNCTLIGNTSAWGGGGAIACEESGQATINNCTISFNLSFWGGGIYCNNSNPSIRNCVLWHNIAGGDGAEIAIKSRYYPSTLTVSYSDVAGGSDAAYVESGCTLNWGQGNIDEDPLLTPDGHLLADSPCIDAGDPNLVVDPNTPADIDGDDRIINGRIDIGPDEFLDSDSDRLPDWWEHKYFCNPNIADHNADPDSDGLSNLQEYELYSSDPNTLPYYVDTTNGNDNYDGLSSTAQGGGVGPKKTIQAGIDAADNGDTVLVAAGTYSGPGNRWIDFNSKLIVLSASDGPASTTIDCENVYTRAFNFHLGETPAAAVVGFTIINGLRDYGGAIVCLFSHPQIRNCVISDNTANVAGGGFYCYMSVFTLADCTISDNNPEGVWADYGGVRIKGIVELVSNDWVGNDLMFTGDGVIQMDSPVTLDLTDARIRCDISGPGTIQVQLNSELIIEGDAVVDLHHETDPDLNGQIICDGLLRLRDDATVIDAQIYVNRASFEDNAIILNSVITAEAGTPYGQFFIEDNVHIWLDRIVADGDRYLDLDPTEFDVNNIHIDFIDVNITEGIGSTQGGLFELRGAPGLVSSVSCDPNNEFFCQVVGPETIPPFDPNNWTINRLELVEEAKLNLTNRFDFQAPYDSGGEDETLYVKELILKPNSVLNTAFQHIYYETLDMDTTARVVNMPLLGFSLVNISFNDEIDYLTRVKHNNFQHLSNPVYDRIHIERVEGSGPDPHGMMRMRTLKDLDLQSPSYNQVIDARAKGTFAKASEENITIKFEYLFIEDSFDEAELVVYLSDDPQISENLVEVARIRPPTQGRPGSIGSGRFADFFGIFSRGNLNFTRGTYVELKLRGTGAQCWVNNWDPIVHCNEICRDFDGWGYVNMTDYLILLVEFGLSGPSSDDVNIGCLDLVSDGVINTDDLLAWDMAGVLNLCPPESGESASGNLSLSMPDLWIQTAGESDPLIIFGKPNTSGLYVPDGHRYSFDANGAFVDTVINTEDGRLLTDGNGMLYQIDVEKGLICHDTGTITIVIEPDYDIPFENSLVSVGVKNATGLPLSDAAFHPYDPNIVYVVPVVVTPQEGEGCPYLAAAKLGLTGDGNYNLLELYGKNPATDPEQNNTLEDCNNFRNYIYEPDVQHLHEIEIDLAGNLFVLSAHYLNTNNWILVYDEADPDMEMRVFLDEPNLIGPAAMVVSLFSNKIYITSSGNVPNDLNNLKTKVHRFSIDRTEGSVTDFTTVDVNCPMPNTDICDILPGLCDLNQNFISAITSMIENPADGTLYVTGFTAPKFKDEYTFPFYTPPLPIFTTPLLAAIPSDFNDSVEAATIIGCDLALPLSIAWTGDNLLDECGGADLDNSGNVGYLDLAILASQWLDTPGDPSADIAPWPGGDGIVNLKDMAILANNWLETSCN